jgi:hypothetical protein
MTIVKEAAGSASMQPDAAMVYNVCIGGVLVKD